MPNPDGSPTHEELIAANPGLQSQVAAMPVPTPQASQEPSLLKQMISAGVMPQAQAQVTPAPTPVMGAHAARGPMGELTAGLPSLYEQTVRPPKFESIKPLESIPYKAPAETKGAPITFTQSAPGGANLREQTARGFFVPAGVSGGGGRGASTNPFANQMAALESQRAGATQTNAAQLSDSQFQREMLDRDAARVEALAKEREANHAASKAKLAGAATAYDKVVKDVPNESIDSGHWFSSKSTGGQIMAALGMALSGLGGERSAESMTQFVNDQIRTDIDTQRQNIALRKEKHGQAVEGARTAYDMIRSQVHDDDAAADLAHAATLDRIGIELKQRAMLSQDVQTQANYQATNDALNMSKAQLQDKAMAALAKGGGPTFDRKEYIRLKNFYFEKGLDQNTSEAMAMRDLGVAPGPTGTPTLENAPGGKRGQAEERQHANDEANQMFADIKKNPALDKLGIETSLLSKLPGSVAPESNTTAVEVKGLNLELLGAASKVLKDNEGRIPPATLERLHELEIPLDTTNKKVALAHVQAYQNFVNSLARQGGSTTPTAPQSLQQKFAGFKPASAD